MPIHFLCFELVQQ